MNNIISKELLWASYFEHKKYAKDLQLFLPLNHPKRLKIESAIIEIENEINNQEI